jgi:hypothetical protein
MKSSKSGVICPKNRIWCKASQGHIHLVQTKIYYSPGKVSHAMDAAAVNVSPLACLLLNACLSMPSYLTLLLSDVLAHESVCSLYFEMSKNVKQKFRTYIFLCYTLTKSFHEKSTCRVACVKKKKFNT